MAVKKIVGKNQSQRLDAKTPGPIAGFLVGVKRNVGKFKSNLYTLREKSGAESQVWGCAAVDNALFPAKGPSPYMGLMVRLTFKGKRKIKGRKQPMRDVSVEVDESCSLVGKKGGKTYQLKQ